MSTWDSAAWRSAAEEAAAETAEKPRLVIHRSAHSSGDRAGPILTNGNNRVAGRPKALVNYDEAETWFIHGAPDERDSRIIEFPTLSHLAKMLGVSLASVGAQAKKRNWRNRRDLVRAEAIKAATEAERSRARQPQEPLEVLDQYIGVFAEAVRTKSLRMDAVSDFVTAIKAREWLVQQRLNTQTQTQALTLDQLHERHAASRAESATMDDATSGVITEGDAAAGIEAPLERVHEAAEEPDEPDEPDWLAEEPSAPPDEPDEQADEPLERSSEAIAAPKPAPKPAPPSRAATVQKRPTPPVDPAEPAKRGPGRPRLPRDADGRIVRPGAPPRVKRKRMGRIPSPPIRQG